MKIVYDNGEANINRIPMAYACCDKCENPNRFAIGFINEPLVNPWDEEEHKYCEKCGAFMDWKTVNLESQYKIFLADHDRQKRAEVLGEIFNAIKENAIICNDGETEIVELVNIVKCIEQLKEQK